MELKHEPTHPRALPFVRRSFIMFMECQGSVMDHFAGGYKAATRHKKEFYSHLESLPGVYCDLDPAIKGPMSWQRHEHDYLQAIQVRCLEELSVADRLMPVRLLCYKGPVRFYGKASEPVLFLPDQKQRDGHALQIQAVTARQLGIHKPLTATVLWLTLTHEADAEAVDAFVTGVRHLFREVVITYTEELESTKSQFRAVRQWLLKLWGPLILPQLDDHDYTAKQQLALYLKEHSEDAVAHQLDALHMLREPIMTFRGLSGALYQGQVPLHTSRMPWQSLNTLKRESHYWLNSATCPPRKVAQAQDTLYVCPGLWTLCRRSAFQIAYTLGSPDYAARKMVCLWFSVDTATALELVLRMLCTMFHSHYCFAHVPLSSDQEWPQGAERVFLSCDLKQSASLETACELLRGRIASQARDHQGVYVVFYNAPRFPTLARLQELPWPGRDVLSFPLTLQCGKELSPGVPVLRALQFDSTTLPTLSRSFPSANVKRLRNLCWVHDPVAFSTEAPEVITHATDGVNYVLVHPAKGTGHSVHILCFYNGSRQSRVMNVKVHWSQPSGTTVQEDEPVFYLLVEDTDEKEEARKGRLLRLPSSNLAHLVLFCHMAHFKDTAYRDQGRILLPSCSELLPLKMLFYIHCNVVPPSLRHGRKVNILTYCLGWEEKVWEAVDVELRLFCNFWSDCPVSYLLLSVKLTRPAESAYMIVLPVSAEKEKWLEPVSLKREDPLVLWQALCGRLKHQSVFLHSFADDGKMSWANALKGGKA